MSNKQDEPQRGSYKAKVDDQVVTFDKPDPLGREMMQRIDRDPEHFFLVFRIPGQPDEVVELDEPFDLSAPGTEEFDLVTRDRHFTILVNEDQHRVVGPYITGHQILALEGKDDGEHYVTQILPGDDIEVNPNDRIDLTKPGTERFTIFVRKCEIWVNTRPHPYKGRQITFNEVVRLAFDTSGDDANTVYTVSYSNGDPSKPIGSMVKGEHVKVHCGMEFDVDRTNRS